MKVWGQAVSAVAAVWLLAWFASPALSQSFDCANATSATEREICNSMTLSDLDTELAGIYQSARSKNSDGKTSALKDAQRQWIARRNACRDSVICIEEAYRERIDSLIAAYDLFPGWAGTYEDPRGGLQFRITETSNANYEIEFTGFGTDYTCGPVSGAGNVEDLTLLASFEDGTSVDLERLGTGVFVPETSGSSQLQSDNCGARAPQLAGTFFFRR